MDKDKWHGTLGSPEWPKPRCVASSDEIARPNYSEIDASEYQDSPQVLKAKVKLLAELFRKSKASCVYTGAGISTGAGIGDYASKARSSIAPHQRTASTRSVSRFGAEPTFSHHLLAAMARRKMLHHWLQQNHDRLAQKAGYPQDALCEIHGAWGDHKNSVLMMDDPLRSDMIEWAEAWARRTDLCVAMGTSLCGMTADCVAAAAGSRGCLVIINLQATPMDPQCAVRIWGVLDHVMGMLARELRIRVPDKACKAAGDDWVRRHPGLRYNTPIRKAGTKM
eukprot:gnl/Dysnectes_brevis/7748_a13300_238.p1 GENE.gnl/Dysnectes_brevis/7748_a13300_238~~gnl/Dysnectes_brevis/7748_a13300_238.p1  ORF type:complete len:280 (-),score=19.88 gnl/Dysnectes_brevis/7748_a13300_238:31-870(-)